MGRRYCVNISKEMVASSKSVSSTVDTQSGAFMPVSVGPEGSGPMIVGSTQHYLVKDARLEISSRLPLQTDIRTNMCLEAFLKINPCVWCTTCVTMRKELVL